MKKLLKSWRNFIDNPPTLTLVKLTAIFMILVAILATMVNADSYLNLRNLATVVSGPSITSTTSACLTQTQKNTLLNQQATLLTQRNTYQAEVNSLVGSSTVSTTTVARINSLKSSLTAKKIDMDSFKNLYNSYYLTAQSNLTTANSYLSQRDSLKKPSNPRQAAVYRNYYNSYNNSYNTYLGYYNTYNSYYTTALAKYNTAKAEYNALQAQLNSLSTNTPTTSATTTARINTLFTSLNSLQTQINTLSTQLSAPTCAGGTTGQGPTYGYDANGNYIRQPAVTGTARGGEACLTTSDCMSDYICNQGTCQSGSSCNTDADCSAGNASSGSLCITSRHICVNPNTSDACNSNSNCSGGQQCYDGVCSDSDPKHQSCTSDAQCSSNTQTCLNGSCQDKTDGSCDDSSDCNSGDSCVAGKCEDNSSGGGSGSGDAIDCCVCHMPSNPDSVIATNMLSCEDDAKYANCDAAHTHKVNGGDGNTGYSNFDGYLCAYGHEPTSNVWDSDEVERLIKNIRIHAFYYDHSNTAGCEDLFDKGISLAAIGAASGSSVNYNNCLTCGEGSNSDSLADKASQDMKDYENKNVVVITGNQMTYFTDGEANNGLCVNYALSSNGYSKSYETCPPEGSWCSPVGGSGKCYKDSQEVIYLCVSEDYDTTTSPGIEYGKYMIDWENL